MAYDRLIAEFDEERWVTFRRADQPPAEYSRAEFQAPKGFALGDALEAARATGWVVERQGGHWIDHEVGCTALAKFVVAMLDYFDAPSAPSKRLVRIKQTLDHWLDGESEEARFSPWVCAWLDLMVRDDAKEDVMTAEDVWRADSLQIDLAKHRERRLREALARLQEQPEPIEAADTADTGRMAPSQRSRRTADQQRRDVG